jgi:PKD repeat protein
MKGGENNMFGFNFTRRKFLKWLATCAASLGLSQFDFLGMQKHLISPALADNQPPVADAGPNQNIYTKDTAVLHGSAMDPDGDPIVYWHWVVVDAPPAATWVLSNDDYSIAFFTPNMAGDYMLALVVGDLYAYSTPSYVVVHVADNLPPVAVINADPISGEVPLTVCFDASQSYDPEGGPLAFTFDFADGNHVDGQVSVCHIYTTAGTYNAGLMVVDERGVVDLDEVTITVNPPTNHPPVASPTAEPNSGDAPLMVQFDADASDPDGDPITYNWDFGDPSSPDNTSTAAEPSHEYQTPGIYIVSLTVSDGELSASYSITITVSSEINLSIRYAAVKFWNKQKTMGDVRIWADFDATMPAANDLISVTFDNIMLFSIPFSEFKHGLMPGVYWYIKKGYIIRLDFANGQISVNTPKILLTGLDNSNGVDVKLMVGDDVAVENIVMMPAFGNRLIYLRFDATDDSM